MPEPIAPAKAKLLEIVLPSQGASVRLTGKNDVEVDFNPETLKVTHANTIEAKDQSGGASAQYVAKSSTKLAVELWFDVTTSETDKDVRERTKKVVHFMTPGEQKGGQDKKFVPPGVRFAWGSFLFDGVMETMDETIELFSPEGRPLRSRVSLSLSSQDIQYRIEPVSTAAPQTPGTQPRQQLRQDESVQQAVGRSGRPEDWPAVAAANGIENPRRPQPGQFIDPHAGAARR